MEMSQNKTKLSAVVPEDITQNLTSPPKGVVSIIGRHTSRFDKTLDTETACGVPSS